MSPERQPELRRQQGRGVRVRQQGVVLLMALIALLLISAVGAAILFMASGESSLVGSQRLIAQAFFAAQAGLQEGKGRVIGTDPAAFSKLVPPIPLPVAVGQVIYITNPAPLEVVNPTDPANPYFDAQYQDEFGVAVPAAPPTILVNSTQPTVAGVPAIPYKWVRVTIKTEFAARNDINLDTLLDSAIPIYHDGRREFVGPPAPPAAGQMVYRLTSLAVMYNTTRALLQMEIGGAPLPGFIVDGNLRINGNPQVMGDGGSVHANGDLDLPGAPCAEQYFGSVGTMTGIGNDKGGAACTTAEVDLRPGEEPITLPEFHPTDYRPTGGDPRCLAPNLPCYILGNDGTVRDQDGNVLGLGSTGWNDWSWDLGGVRWVAGNDIPAGTYYVEGNANISGNPGSGPPGTPPIQLTLITEGYVEISGNPNIGPAGAMLAGTSPITVLTGDDLKISGNPGTTYSGLYYAGDQLGFSGNPNINGQVMASNFDDNPSPGGVNMLVLVQPGNFMEVSGNPTITFGGGGGFLGLRATAWRELR